MKQALTLVITLLLSYASFAQAPYGFTLTFEDTAVLNQYYYTDSLFDSAGIWQIGQPNKALFDSAHSPTHAVVTLLDSALPKGIRASFVVKTINPQSYSTNDILIFHHKFDFDSAKSGGTVEFSIDEGLGWYPINLKNGNCFVSYNPLCVAGYVIFINGVEVPAPVFLGPQPDTMPNGMPYFTGIDSVWITDTIAFPQTTFPTKTQNQYPLWFRFTAFSDSTASATHAGWLIDDIQYMPTGFACTYGSVNEINSSHLHISPNPVENGFHIVLTDEANSGYTVSLIDLTGREMMRSHFTGKEVTLRRNGLAAGSYIIKVTNTRSQDTFEKRVVFE